MQLSDIIKKVRRQMTRQSEKYLGKTVPTDDLKELMTDPQLDTVEEAVGITASILQQFVDGKLDYTTAKRRLNYLKPIIEYRSKIPDKEKPTALKYVETALIQLDALKDKKVKSVVAKRQKDRTPSRKTKSKTKTRTKRTSKRTNRTRKK